MGNIQTKSFESANGNIHFSLKSPNGEVSFVFEYESMAEKFRQLIPYMTMLNLTPPKGYHFKKDSEFKLPFDFKLIDSKPVENTPYASIVFCKNNEKYVTWFYNHEDNACYHGHYFDIVDGQLEKINAFKKAASDFAERRM